MVSVASRSIFIRAYPRTKSLSESKAILSRLEKHGRIATFRNLQYDVTNTAHATSTALLAIFESAQSAEKALRASPLYIPLPSSSHATANPRLRSLHNSADQPNKTNSKLKTRTQQSADDSNPLHPWTASSIAHENALPPDLRCELDWSRHNHELAQPRNPYYGFFDVDSQSVQYWDLRSVTGTPLEGLSDCLMARKKYMAEKLRASIDELNRGFGVRSLWGVYEEGLRRKRVERN